MESGFQEEIEMIDTLKEYNVKVVKALEEVVPELKGEPKEDTDEYLQYIFKGVTWELQVLNGTMDYINRDREIVVKDHINEIVARLNEAISDKDNEKIAGIIENGLLPFLEKLNQI